MERLSVYLPTEHIDNPKGTFTLFICLHVAHYLGSGYGEGEDARKYDSRLRGPVDVGYLISKAASYNVITLA